MRRRRLAPAIVLLLASLLTVPPAATAQVDDDAPGEPIGPRFEMGVGGGLMVAYPEFGALASIPIGAGASFELSVSWMPPIIYEREHGLVQAQVRLPFRPHLRSRRSLLVGVTRLSTRRRHPFDSGFWGNDLTHLFPHAGVSLQWPLGRRRLDLRFDAHGLFTLDSTLPLVARGTAMLVWHPGSAR